MSHWKTSADSIRYSIHIRNDRVHLTKDTGVKETSGFNEVPLSRFLRSSRLQKHVAELYGEAVLEEVKASCETILGKN
jgi:hypothetical protein